MGYKFDIDELNTLVKSFHNISSVKIGMCLPDGSTIGVDGGNECEFCRLVRGNKDFFNKCMQNDKRAFELAMQGKSSVYRCHAGLYESVAPIMYDNKPVACIMIGQIAPEVPHENISKELSVRLAGHERLEEIIEAFKKMPHRSDDYVMSSVRIMSACAGYIYLNNLVTIERSSISERFKDYIENNYFEAIDLKTMADTLGVCVTKLCNEIRAQCNSSPHAMLKACRIRKAKELLLKTNLPICEIAASVGISDYNYFSRIFKQSENMTPSQFRNQGLN